MSVSLSSVWLAGEAAEQASVASNGCKKQAACAVLVAAMSLLDLLVIQLSCH